MYPLLEIDVAKLQHNAREINKIIGSRGGTTFAVTKVVGGDPEVGKALVAGGVQGLADSRLGNIERLRQAGITVPILLLRAPALSQISSAVRLTDLGLNSEKTTIAALSREALNQHKQYGIILMVDLGDGREGVAPQALAGLYRYTLALPNLFVYGLGTNLACFSGVTPTYDLLHQLIDLKNEIDLGVNMVLSGGNSSGLYLFSQDSQTNSWLGEINHWRIGESIFLGQDITTKKPFDNCFTDACVVKAEVIEIQEKAIADHGPTIRIVVAIGLQEIGAGRLLPTAPGYEVIGCSSDHLVMAAAGRGMPAARVGDVVAFYPDYQGLLAAATSPYITIRYNSHCL